MVRPISSDAIEGTRWNSKGVELVSFEGPLKGKVSQLAGWPPVNITVINSSKTLLQYVIMDHSRIS